jgi:PAS domain S-box-containing protein
MDSEILDTATGQPLEELARLAAQIFQTPIALVTLLDATRQWFKARVQYPATETPREYAFCYHTVRHADVLVVRDTLADPRFATNPYVAGEPFIRFYAGAPLVTPDGNAIGTLAVLDHVPRDPTPSQIVALQIASRQVVAQLELRKHLAGAVRSQARATHLTSVLTDAAIDCVVAIDHQGRFVEFNRSAERAFGYKRDEVLGQDMVELIVPPEYRDAHRAGVSRYLSSGHAKNTGRRLELVGMRRDGSRFPIELSVNRVEGSPPVFAGFLRDLTERRATEAALQRNIARFELVARASNDVVWDRDLATGTIWWSDAFDRTYGFGIEDNEGWLARIHQDDRPRVADGLRGAIERGSGWNDEYRIQRHDKQYATIFDRGYVMCDDAGRPTRMVGAMIDLTERRRLEEQVLRSQKMEAIGQLAGGIAHDFNNILTIIECNAFMLAEGVKDTDHEGSVAEIRQATDRAAALTRQLLLISRKQPARREIANLNTIVDSMSRMLNRVLGEHVALEVLLTTGLPSIDADVAMIEQVLLNLAVNARDAMPRGGRLSISTATRRLREPLVVQGVVIPAARYVTLEVADSGSGIPDDVLPRIFEPFFTTKDVGKGTGLGLSTVLGIVRQHGGAIDVRSDATTGTSFSVYLPAIDSAVVAKPVVDETGVYRGTERLLVVEDEPLLRTGLVAFLQRCGYSTIEAPSAIAALDVWRAEQAKIDLVITDIVMPGGMTGRELAAHLHRERPALPIIFTSGYADEAPDDPEQLIEGFNFLAKPYAPRELARLIRNRLS